MDGPSAAGKTTFADELVAALVAAGRSCLRVSIDDFHRPGHKWRSMRGEWTPSLYLAEGYDWALFRAAVLDPIGPGGDRRVRVAAFDSLRDEPVPETWTVVAKDAVVVVDGMYLLGPDWAGRFDYRIWLDVAPHVVLERACARDVAWVGSVSAVRARYERFWLPAHARYEEELRPRSRADAVVLNEPFDTPLLR